MMLDDKILQDAANRLGMTPTLVRRVVETWHDVASSAAAKKRSAKGPTYNA